MSPRPPRARQALASVALKVVVLRRSITAGSPSQRAASRSSSVAS